MAFASGPAAVPTPDPAVEAWHALDAEAALARFGTAPTGLATDEAARRLAAHGPNRIAPPPRRGWLRRLAAQFHNVLIYLLLVAAAVTIALGHHVDAGIIAAVVMLNAIIGALQEGRAERSLDAIRRMLSSEALVLRDGKRSTVPAETLVPGDIVVVQSGDKVPADLRLIRVRDLRVDESALTGESVPVEKDAAASAATAAIADRRGVAWSGTLVTYGQATGVVAATGDATELGRINAMIAAAPVVATPLLQQVDRFGRWLSLIIVAVSVTVFLIAAVGWGRPLDEVFLATVSLAVAAIPEGLPAILTITLAVGVQRMAARRAIIRRLPAIDTLGSVTVVCTDKTGTLTRNEMTVRSLATPTGDYAVSGGGYAPVGAFHRDGEEIRVEHHADLIEALRAGLLCNDARIVDHAGSWSLIGDPTEGALVTVAAKAGLLADSETAQHPRVDAIPFESEHRFMATLHHDHRGGGAIYVKGAPERILAMCDRSGASGTDGFAAADWQARAEAMAARGERVLALAMRPAAADLTVVRFDDVTGGLRLLGLVGMIDPPRDEATAAVAECRMAGIRVKMITGDHALTARAIGAAMGIGDGRHALTGADLDRLDGAALRVAAREVDVFARVSPEHKLRLVEAIAADGHVVAMTGDGVNDAPALKRADVGVAMGRGGTEVAKEAADMVITDDDFASIRHAVEIGRSVYDNLRKAILFTLPTNGGEALTVMLALVAGVTMPITPVQILWVNMVTSVLLSIGLAFEAPEPDIMHRPPRRPGASLLPPMFVWRIVLVSVLMCAGTFGLFLAVIGAGGSVEDGRTAAVNALVLCECVYLLNTRSILRPAFTRAGARNPLIWLGILVVLLMQGLYTYLPASQRLFGTTAIGAGVWGGVFGIAILLFLAVELEKTAMRRWHLRRHLHPARTPAA